MHITELSILNYLGIGVLKVDKLGKFNLIKGRNRIGKSSVLKAITEAFVSSGSDPRVINIEADQAEIAIRLDDVVEVYRKIRRTGDTADNTVRVVVDGQPVNEPTKYLKGLIGASQFNPVDFYLKRDKERREALLRAIHFTLSKTGLAGILGGDAALVDLDKYDFSGHGIVLLDALRTDVYERRHEQNLHVIRLKKALEQDRADIPATLNQQQLSDFDLEVATENLAEATRQVQENEGKKAQLDHLRRARQKALEDIEGTVRKIDSLEAEIQRLRVDLESQKTKADQVLADGLRLKGEIETFVAPPVDDIRGQIASYRANQAAVYKLQEIAKREETLLAEEDRHLALDKLYRRLTGEIPRLCLDKIKLPIKGLTFQGDDIFVNGVSIDKLSTSEQMVFAVELAKALAGPLKVINIDRFEALDPEAREAFERAAAGDDFEYFITCVTSGELQFEVKAAEQGNGNGAPAEAPAEAPRRKGVRVTPTAKEAPLGHDRVGF